LSIWSRIGATAELSFRPTGKGRRITRFNNSRQLSAIRDLAGEDFDYLAGILFNEDYTVMKVALIPRSVALERASFVEYTNSHKLMLRNDLWSAAGVRDVTAELRAVNLQRQITLKEAQWSILQSFWGRGLHALKGRPLKGGSSRIISRRLISGKARRRWIVN
jgi:hypothetical protein